MEIEDAVKFHGHMCPGLAIGFRVAKLAEEHFGTRSKDEELVAIVENKSCSVDAIQVVNSCTFGKGNLIFRDFGKHVYTFFKRGDEKALRISLRQEVFERGNNGNDLFKKVRSGTATSEEMAEYKKEREENIKMIMEAPADELFKIKEIKAEPPQKAVIFQTLTCSECGEGIMESRARVAHGEYFCLPCFEKYDV